MRIALAALLSIATSALAADFTPLMDLGNGSYLGHRGGLYENGSNWVPPDHMAVGLLHAASIAPRDRDGRLSATGKIVLVSIGMSNTTQEFCAPGNPAPCSSWSFVGQAAGDVQVNHDTLVLVNGARGGQTAATWDSPADVNYDKVRDENLAPAGLTEAQVQAAWVKVANAQPAKSLPAADADAYVLLEQMGAIARALKVRYPNIQLAYFSSRIYAGYASTRLNPEPYAYESGFAVKWLVAAQIAQERSGKIDSSAGDLSAAVAPWIAWGPYLWTNGTVPRSDGLIWERADVQSDGTHPSPSGQEKVGRLLLQFFKSEPTAQGWFVEAPTTGPRRRSARH